MPPWVSTGGADDWLTSAPATLARAELPWQLVQARLTRSTVPFRWTARLTVTEVYPGWQLPQATL